MDIILLSKAFILGIVEGITEFLPISSTGHLIIAGQLINFTGERAKLFEIVIQGAAVLAIIWEYRYRFIPLLDIRTDPKMQAFAGHLLLAFLPLAILGLLFHKTLKAWLFNAPTVALAFIIGGIIILWIERKEQIPRIHHTENMTWKDALALGFIQALALIPGTSRSGATIIGGLYLGLSRQCATEFSFFLAVPTLLAATGYSLWKERAMLDINDWDLWLTGTLTAFISAFICIRWLIGYIATHRFTLFAWYRIAFGILILATAQLGWINWSA